MFYYAWSILKFVQWDFMEGWGVWSPPLGYATGLTIYCIISIFSVVYNVQFVNVYFRYENRSCQMMPPCVHSSCLQRYTAVQLLSTDPQSPDHSPSVDTFLLPGGCSCYIEFHWAKRLFDKENPTILTTMWYNRLTIMIYDNFFNVQILIWNLLVILLIVLSFNFVHIG